MKRKAYSREVRKDMIISAVYYINNWFSKLSVSVYDVAKRLDMTPSPHLRSMMEELVTEGKLDKQIVSHRKNVTKALYSLPVDDAFSDTKKHDELIIKLNGKVV